MERRVIMLKKVFNERIYCGLDIGAQRIKVSLLKFNGSHHSDLLALHEVPTQGFKGGSVSDLGELSEAVSAAMTGLQKKSGVRLKDVYLGLGGDMVDYRLTSAVIPLVEKGNKAILFSDVKKASHQANLLGVKLDEEILHDFPQYFRVDDINMASNPVGLFGRKLEAVILLIVAQLNRMNNVVKAVHQAGFDVAKVFYNSLAAGEVTLSKRMKIDGCALVDLGADITSILVYKDGVLRYCGVLSFGGERVTKRLAQELSLTFDLCEEIKKSYASAVQGDKDSTEEILVKKESGYIPIKKNVICQSIENDIEQMVSGIKAKILESGLFEHLNAGIVIAGGGALLPGLLERIESVTKLPVSMGKSQISSHKIPNSALFSGSIGLAVLGQQKASLSHEPALTEAQQRWHNRASNFLRELYQEYF